MRREDIFTVENQQLVLNKEYLRGIEAFRTILEKKLVTDGDFNGRKKLQHWKLFMYIKIVADLFSYPNQGGYNDKALHNEACKVSGLEDNYKPDKDVLNAVIEFKRIQMIQLPVLNSINTLLKACKLSDVVCQNIIANMEASIEIYNKKIQVQKDSGEVTNVADSILLVNGLIDQLGQITKLAMSVPKTQETLEKLDERLKRESSGEVMARGGKKIGNRAEHPSQRINNI